MAIIDGKRLDFFVALFMDDASACLELDNSAIEAASPDPS
jgi:hypothetical protein